MTFGATAHYAVYMGHGRRRESGRARSPLCRARLRAGLSQAQLAERIGVSASAIARYESGRRTLPPARAAALASALVVPVKSILPPAVAARTSSVRWNAVRRDAYQFLSVAAAVGLSDDEVDAGHRLLRGLERAASSFSPAQAIILLKVLGPLLDSVRRAVHAGTSESV